MKIGLYGISRSGKNYLIDRAIASSPQLHTLQGSNTLKRLSIEILNKTFDKTTEDEKYELRVVFANAVKNAERQFNSIVVDGHFAFPTENNEFQVVFTDADKKLYDIFIYLNTNPEQILENQKQPSQGRVVKQHTIEEIDSWQKFEKNKMQAICDSLGKELYILDGDTTCCIEFLKDLVAQPQNFEPQKIVKKIVTDNLNYLSTVNTVILIDCDRTLTFNDTTVDFCDAVGIDKKIVKGNFKGEYYSAYQFYKTNALYDKVLDKHYFSACDLAENRARLNEHLIADIKRCRQSCTRIGITSGIVDIWERISDKINFLQLLIGKGRTCGNFVSATLKRMLVEELHLLGKQVIAIGDSKIDLGMLETADKGFIVANEKLSESVTNYYIQNPMTRIKQLSYSAFKYNGIKEVDSLWE